MKKASTSTSVCVSVCVCIRDAPIPDRAVPIIGLAIISATNRENLAHIGNR